jgi:hypothetical protein
MSVQYSGNKITFADGSIVASGWSGFKNRIINGAMVIDQRNAGASQTITSNSTYFGVDRFRLGISGTNSYSLSVQQVSDAPSGFVNSQKYTVNTATTIASGDTFQTGQRIEYSNCSDFGWFDSTTRYYVSTYTINSANTWEQKTITVASPISGGATVTLSFWVKSSLTGTFAVLFTTSPSPSTTGTGLYVCFDLGQGSTYQTSSPNVWGTTAYISTTTATRLMANSGATWQITGVQLEKGSTATSFDYRPYGTELALCQRYYESQDGTSGNRFIISALSGSSGGFHFQWINLLAPKRATPTVALVNQSYNAANSGSSSNPSVTGFLAQYTITTTSSYMFSGYTASAEL